MRDACRLAFGTATRLAESFSRFECKVAREAARGLDVDALPLPLERTTEVLEVVEQLLFGNSHRGGQLLERGRSIAERPSECLAHGLASLRRRARFGSSAIVAPSAHEPRMRATMRTSNARD